MIPATPEELQVLAGEYVLGVLEPVASREVEAALAGNVQLRRAVIFWEERLQELSRLAGAAAPPPELWDKIAARVGGPVQKARPRLWTSLVLWRSATALAAAAAALALYIALARPPPNPSLVAVLHAPQRSEPVWIATAGRGGLSLRALAGQTAPPDRVFELWVIAPGARRPQALGVVPADHRLALSQLPEMIRAGGTLAISVEPEGGSPTGQPTGPVLFTGMLVAAK